MTTKSRNNDRRIVENAGAVWVVLIVGIVWMAMVSGDWLMRFHWFRWHQTWVYRPATIRSETLREPSATTNAARFGGDLTRLAAVPEVTEKYGEKRPEAVFYTDEYGYPNRPPVHGKTFPVVVVGDSYMAKGITMEDTVAEQLAGVSGLDVYNHGLVGWGSFLSVSRFLRSERFKTNPPAYLVFGIIEREVEGTYFEGLKYHLYVIKHPDEKRVSRTGLDLRNFRPSVLKRDLADTSIIAQMSSRFWNGTRYSWFGQLAPYVIASTEPIGGQDVLFYFPSIDAMKWSVERRDVLRVASAVQYLEDICNERGIRLVVLLIPDKEQVYRETIPDRYEPIPPSCLGDLAQALEARGILTVNLLEVYREHAGRGKFLYWADDTHWNPQGIRIAAEETWAAIEGEVND